MLKGTDDQSPLSPCDPPTIHHNAHPPKPSGTERWMFTCILCIFFRMIHESMLFHVFTSITPSYIEYSSVSTLISPSETVLSVFFVSALDRFLLTKNLVLPLLSVNVCIGGLSPSYIPLLLKLLLRGLSCLILFSPAVI